MGVWDTIYWIGDGVKAISPDLSSLKTAGSATYHHTSAAVAKIDQVVRVNGIQNLPQYWPDAEARASICVFTTKLAQNTAKYAVHEGFKHIPGAEVSSKLVSQTLHDMRNESHKDQIKTMKSKVDLKKSTSPPQTFSESGKLRSQSAGGAMKVEEMINSFMWSEFVGNHLFRDLMVKEK